MNIYTQMAITVSTSFLDERLPENFEEMERYDVLDFIEENLSDGLTNLDPETVLETIENIAGDAVFTARRNLT